MILQEEVIRIMTDPLCSVEHRADKIVSKILDAVVEEFNEEADQVVLKGDYDEGIHDAHRIEAPRIINKLRDES